MAANPVKLTPAIARATMSRVLGRSETRNDCATQRSSSLVPHALPFPYRKRKWAVLNLNGYFDESGIHAQAPVIVVAGYVAPEREWRRFEAKWKRVLRDSGVSQYHTKDIEAVPPQGVYEGWSRKRADKLTDRVVHIAANFQGRAFGVHILKSVWHAAVPFVQKYLPNRPHSGPYMLLARECISAVVDLYDENFKERIGFVFASNDFTHQMVKDYQTMKEVHPRSSVLGPLAIVDANDNVMLQSGDLIAWHYRHAIETKEELRHGPLHRATRSLIRNSDEFRYVPKGHLSAEVDNLFKQYGAKWNQRIWAEMVDREQRREERRKREEKWRGGPS
jgi:hypothetical protein